MILPTKVFLDLEDTVIKTWQDPQLTNIGKLRVFLGELPQPVDELHIFSFAIHNDEDKEIFDNEIRAPIELALGIPVVEWMSVLEMMKLSEQWTSLNWRGDVCDFIQCRGKHYAFYDVMQQRERDCRCILVDDGVPHMNTLTVPLSNLTLQFVNVYNLV